MKKLIPFLISLVLACPAFAGLQHVTSLNSSTAKTVVVPSVATQVIILQNTGSNAVRLSIDGGASYTDPNTGITGTNPTTALGYNLAAGATLTITTQPGNSSGGPAVLHSPIVAIMVTGTTTLEVITDDGLATFPTS